MLISTLHLTENKRAEVLGKIKTCTFCRGKPTSALKKFISHNTQRTDFICSPCCNKLGKPKVQQILEDLPFHGNQTNFKKKKELEQ